MNAPTIACPNCGYDQAGAMSRWTESCPLESRCTECGKSLRWGALLGTEKSKHNWFVEEAQGVFQFAAYGVLTWLHLISPPMFWSDAVMKQQPHLVKALRWLLTTLGVLYLISGISREAVIVCEMLRPGHAAPSPLLSLRDVMLWPLLGADPYLQMRASQRTLWDTFPTWTWPWWLGPAIAINIGVGVILRLGWKKADWQSVSRLKQAFVYSWWWVSFMFFRSALHGIVGGDEVIGGWTQDSRWWRGTVYEAGFSTSNFLLALATGAWLAAYWAAFVAACVRSRRNAISDSPPHPANDSGTQTNLESKEIS